MALLWWMMLGNAVAQRLCFTSFNLGKIMHTDELSWISHYCHELHIRCHELYTQTRRKCPRCMMLRRDCASTPSILAKSQNHSHRWFDTKCINCPELHKNCHELHIHCHELDTQKETKTPSVEEVAQKLCFNSFKLGKSTHIDELIRTPYPLSRTLYVISRTLFTWWDEDALGGGCCAETVFHLLQSQQHHAHRWTVMNSIWLSRTPYSLSRTLYTGRDENALGGRSCAETVPPLQLRQNRVLLAHSPRVPWQRLADSRYVGWWL